MPAIRRTPGLGSYLASLAASGVIAGLAAGVIVALDGRGPLSVAGIGLAVAVALTVLTWVCVAWWSRLDEAAREAHKWAWWWGGTAGTALAGVILIGLQRTAFADTALVGPHPLDSLSAGVLIVLLSQLAGYAVAWAAWWLARR